MNTIRKIDCYRFSSNYGESNNSYGQPLGVKTIAIITVTSSNGDSRSHELYAGIYCPEILPNIISNISNFYIGKEINLDNNLKENKFPFIGNSGIIKSIIGGIDSCIIQLYFSSRNIMLVDGLKSLIKPSLRRSKSSSKIKYYGSGGSVAYSAEECLKDLKTTFFRNYDGFKMRCGLQNIEKDFERVAKVSNFIAKDKQNKDFALMIDFIQGTLKSKLSPIQLKEYLIRFKNFNINWYEEPLDPDNISLYESFTTTQLGIFNLCLGESFTCLNEFAAYKNIINFFQLDVTHLGGFPEAIKVLNYMEKFYPKIKFSSHLWGSGLSGLLNLALCRASESIIWFEVPLLEFDINKHIFKEKELDFSNISNKEIDSYLGDLNLDRNSNYDFIENSGYKI